MPQTNLNKRFHAKPTQIKTIIDEDEMSMLGKKLMKIAKEIEASNDPEFDEADVEKELKKRRGGFIRNGE